MTKMSNETAALYEKVSAFEEHRSDQVPTLADRINLADGMALDGIMKVNGEMHARLLTLYGAIIDEVTRIAGPVANNGIGVFSGPSIQNGVPADFQVEVTPFIAGPSEGRVYTYNIVIL